MTCGIYIIRSRVTNRYYVGQSRNIEQRIKAHARLVAGVSAARLYGAIIEMWFDCEIDFDEAFEWWIERSCAPCDLNQAERAVERGLRDKGAILYNAQECGSPLTRTQRHRDRIGAAHRGKIVTQQTRQKLRAALEGRGAGGSNPNARPVKNITTGQVFDTGRLAAESIGRTPSAICVAAKKQTLCAGYSWAYV